MNHRRPSAGSDPADPNAIRMSTTSGGGTFGKSRKQRISQSPSSWAFTRMATPSLERLDERSGRIVLTDRHAGPRPTAHSRPIQRRADCIAENIFRIAWA